MKEKFHEDQLKNNKTWDENYRMTHYKTIKDGLTMFLDDPLIYKPGTNYEYSSLAYSLVSRIIEERSGKSYVAYMNQVCGELGMPNTFVDLNNPIVLNRSKYMSHISWLFSTCNLVLLSIVKNVIVSIVFY